MPETLSGTTSSAEGPASLRDRRIVVVEDEYILAEDLRAELESQGADVLGLVASVADALELLGQGPPADMAILDINLLGEMVYPLANALRERGVPLLSATGYEARAIPEAYADLPRGREAHADEAPARDPGQLTEGLSREAFWANGSACRAPAPVSKPSVEHRPR